MPTYDFRCPQGHVFERFYSKISNAPSEVECPECGQTATRQVSGGAGLLFKGSGFYLTDYGKNAHRSGGGSSKPAASSSSESSGGGDAKSETKSSDAKPEASSDTKSSASKPPKSSGSGDS